MVGLILGLLTVLAVVITSVFTGQAVFNGSMQMVTNERTSLAKMAGYLEERGFSLDTFRSRYYVESISIASTFQGHEIPADLISPDGNANEDTIVMVHGMGGNRLSVYPIAEMFLNRGYNVLAIDQRSSGENKAPYTTYGYYESNDVSDCVNYVRAIIDEDKQVGLWGMSFGGATVGIYLGASEANELVDFAILDSPISNMRYMLSSSMAEMNIGIPMWYLLLTGDLTTRAKLRFSYEDANVSSHLGKTDVPILIINSRADVVTPFFMGEELYSAISHNDKRLYSVEDSLHGQVFDDYREDYERIVFDFIHKYDNH